jgi:hypothetical protein
MPKHPVDLIDFSSYLNAPAGKHVARVRIDDEGQTVTVLKGSTSSQEEKQALQECLEKEYSCEGFNFNYD